MTQLTFECQQLTLERDAQLTELALELQKVKEERDFLLQGAPLQMRSAVIASRPRCVTAPIAIPQMSAPSCSESNASSCSNSG